MQSDIQAIASRIKLASLSITCWRATKLHKHETQKVNADHHTQDAAIVSVRLVESKTYDAINKLHGAVYDAHRKLTLPAAQEGFRLLPAGREFQHSEQMREFADKHRSLKAHFIAEYEVEKATAPARLNGLYDPRHWPDVSVIAAKFSFNSRYLSCPTDGAWGEWIVESARAANEELTERLRDCLNRIADNCAKEKPKIYDSLFSNLGELIAMVPDLNFDASQVIESCATQAKELSALNPDLIRESKTARQSAAEKASPILKALGAQ